MVFDKGVRQQVFAAIIATLGAMTMGTILGWSSPAAQLLPKYCKFPISDDDTLLYGSVFGLGAVVGALPAGSVSRIIGRRYSMVLFEMFVILGWVCLTMPHAVWMLAMGRVLQGVGIGALCTIIPSYVGEISQPKIRGTLGACFQVFVVVGILYSYVFGAYTKYIVLNVLCGVWSVIHAIGVFIIPESPYYLLSKDRKDDAKESMMKLRGDNADQSSEELTALQDEIQQSKTENHSFFKVISDKVNRKSLLIGVGCMFFQQTSGINVIIFYLTDIFKKTNSSINPEMSSIVVGIVQLIMTFVTMVVIDKVGRRVLLMSSAILMGLSFVGLTFYFMDSNVFADWLPLLFIAVYISAFSIGFGPVPWVVMGEIFSSEVKPYGTSLATATNWLLVFGVTFVPNIIVKSVGNDGLFTTYSVCCYLGAMFVWFVVPETKNKTLAQIQMELAGNSSIP